jgi:hypothetical protein
MVALSKSPLAVALAVNRRFTPVVHCERETQAARHGFIINPSPITYQ